MTYSSMIYPWIIKMFQRGRCLKAFMQTLKQAGYVMSKKEIVKRYYDEKMNKKEKVAYDILKKSQHHRDLLSEL